MRPYSMSCVVMCLLLLCIERVDAEIISVKESNGLKRALSRIKSGSVLQIASGQYPGGLDVRGVANLTIEAADPTQPPQFQGGSYGWHFSNCSGLTLRHLRINGQSRNGLNLDDGGDSKSPMQDVILENIQVSDIGPKGNCDGIKCSGLNKLKITACSVTGWAGQAIDLVGCHQVQVSDCQFTGKQGYAPTSGIQCKGGSEDITIEKCRFVNAGQRPINAGGSTGLAYFRPLGANYEARQILIQSNQIEGSLCACAFTGVDGAIFKGNSILFPEKWVFRILQETTEKDFIPSRNVRIEDNSIVFRRSQVGVEVNVGPNTEPQSFRFSKNRWFAEDRPDRSKPSLPTVEAGGSYGKDPRSTKP